jgi:predicted O-methyltransferase YrrM
VSSTLRSGPVVAVLKRLHAWAQAHDEPAKRRLQESADVGELMYLLTVSAATRQVVEFGASIGFSTIHLAAALRDLGGGSLVTTEFDPWKAERLHENLTEARLEDLVEVRIGDALQTLEGFDRTIDLLFLDGWNDLYVEVLDLLEPSLASHALVIADLSIGDPHNERYLKRVRDLGSGYVSIGIPLDAGVEVSLRSP